MDQGSNSSYLKCRFVAKLGAMIVNLGLCRVGAVAVAGLAGVTPPMPVAFAAPSPAAGTPSPGYLAYGDLRGHIEPCGCDPATDLGGIKRLGVLLERERAAEPNLWLFSLGNNLPPKTEAPLKTEFLLTTDARLAPVAALLNVTEMERLDTIRALKRHAKAAVPRYVLSNAREVKNFADLAAPLVVENGAIVLGYVYDPSVASAVERVSEKLLKSWRKVLALHSEKAYSLKILLYSGSDADLASIAHAGLFDAIISSNSSPMSAIPGTAECYDETRLVRHGVLDVMMVPLGGQGILRGGSLRFSEAKSVAELFKNDGGAASRDSTHAVPLGAGGSAVNPLLKAAKLVTWLDKETAPGDGPLQDLYLRYTAAATAAFRADGAKREQDLAHSPYAGAATCAACHPAAAAAYAKTGHAHAMQTLQDKGKQEDAECVACHSVGARSVGGFVSLATSPQLANVQCENCHGPRLAHAKNPSAKPAVVAPAANIAPAVCLQCHNSQHSPQFDFAKYWPKIAH